MKKITLADFDDSFYKTIPGHEEARVEKSGVYYTILVDGVKAGIVGYLPGASTKEVYFVQIAIAPEFRGTGLVGIAEDLLASKHELPALTATVDKSNVASLKAHLKAGFQEIDSAKLASMREQGFLKEGQTRLVKTTHTGFKV